MVRTRVTLQPTDPAEVQVSELVFSVLDSLQDDQTVPFGSAFPSPELFPLSRLSISMTRGLRALSPQQVVADMTTGHTDLCRQIALRYMLGGIQLPMDELVLSMVHGGAQSSPTVRDSARGLGRD